MLRTIRLHQVEDPQSTWLVAAFPWDRPDAGSVSIHVRAREEITAAHTMRRPQAAKCSVSVLKDALARVSSSERHRRWFTTSKKSTCL